MHYEFFLVFHYTLFIWGEPRLDHVNWWSSPVGLEPSILSVWWPVWFLKLWFLSSESGQYWATSNIKKLVIYLKPPTLHALIEWNWLLIANWLNSNLRCDCLNPWVQLPRLFSFSILCRGIFTLGSSEATCVRWAHLGWGNLWETGDSYEARPMWGGAHEGGFGRRLRLACVIR